MLRNKILDSPTLMTLFSLVSKSLSFIIITPFLLSSFSAEEIAFWYLLGIFINMQSLADFGFYNTFVRVIALAFSGGISKLSDLDRVDDKNRIVTNANIPLAGQIIGTMRWVYIMLSFLLLVVMVALSPLLAKNVNLLNNVFEGWLSWGVVVLFSVSNFIGRPYLNFLLSMNRVALVRRWEGFFNVLALLINIFVVLFSKSLLLLVVTNQMWLFVNVLVNRYLCNNNGLYKYSDFRSYGYNKEVMKCVWPLAWRAGLSSITTQGVVSASGLIYAQFCDAASASSYLFAEKLYNAIRSFAQAPFYSKIPLLVSLRGKNKIMEWESVSQRGMLFASSLMVAGIIGFDVLGTYLFSLIRSNIEFPNYLLWILLGWSYLLHRFGAMHTQLYTTINKVNSHISDLIAGLIMVMVWALFVKYLDVYVFPIGMLCGYLGFYVWYAGYYSYRIIDKSPLVFEMKANLFPFTILSIYTIIRFIIIYIW